MTRLRIRGPNGMSTVTLGDDATVADLRTLIQEKTALRNFDVKYAYPPKPLLLPDSSAPLSSLGVSLNGEQLIISSQEPREQTPPKASPEPSASSAKSSAKAQGTKANTSGGPIPLKRKEMAGDAPELPMLSRGSTLVLRVMPDDNSCLFRAFGTAVLPGDDKTMTELRSLVASVIQSDPGTYTQVVLEQKPDDYCRWIQNSDAWGGAIEMGILSKHFEIEICSIDVQSLRIDRFNNGAPTRCILVYSGIHYDTIVQSPSEPPHTKANLPPDFDRRVFESDDDEILEYSLELCRKLKEKHYFTDTGGMKIRCKVEGCGWVGHGQVQASGHAEMSGHYDMEEVNG